MKSFLLVVALVAVSQVAAFDVGYHWDITRNAAEHVGFAPDAANALGLFTSLAETSDELEHFQALDLEDKHAVEKYFKHLIGLTKTNLGDANSDVLHRVAQIALPLAAVQNFYAHSNWVESFPNIDCDSCYRDETLFSADVPKDLFTGGSESAPYNRNPEDELGMCDIYSEDAENGVNKDYAGRPGFEDAYAFALKASIEFLTAAKGWAEESNPDLSFAVELSEEHKADLEAKFFWIKRTETAHQKLTSDFTITLNGAFKGTGSGDQVVYGVYESSEAAYWLSTESKEDSWGLVFETVSGNFTKDSFDASDVGSLSDVPALALDNFRILNLRVYQVEGLIHAGKAIEDVKSNPDYSLETTIEGLPIYSPVQVGQSFVHPAWTILYGTSKSRVTVTQSLWEETNAGRNPVTETQEGGATITGHVVDDQVDINTLSSSMSVSFIVDVHDSLNPVHNGKFVGECGDDTNCECTGSADDLNCPVLAKAAADHPGYYGEFQGNESDERAKVYFLSVSRSVGCAGESETGKNTTQCDGRYYRDIKPYICTEEGMKAARIRAAAGIGAIVVAVLAAVVGLIVCLVCIWKYKLRKDEEREPEKANMSEFLNARRGSTNAERREGLPGFRR